MSEHNFKKLHNMETTLALFDNKITVKLVRAMAADEFVVQAAQVSAKGETDIQDLIEKYEANEIGIERFVRALVKGKHGSPFEHNAFTFFVEAPLFVFREWQRHRISSFNEMSGRYTTLLPKFYKAPADRPMINVGTKMKPEMIAADYNLWKTYSAHTEALCDQAWDAYQELLAQGVANEVARMVLPVNIYSQMYWTVNARSLMNFLSLRVESEDSAVKSYPQLEIQWGADQVESAFKEKMPVTHKLFVENGRVAP